MARRQDKRKLSDWLEKMVTLSKPNTGETRNIEIEWDDARTEILQDPDVFEFSTAGVVL